MNDGQAAEIIDIDSDGSEDEEEEEFDTYESSVAYNKPARSNFFSRLNNTVQDDEEGIDKIWVQSTDWMINENKAEHHTKEYDNKRLIVRRGAQFDMKLTFDKDFDPKKHSFVFSFYTGDKPSISKGTLRTLHKASKLVNSEWGFTIEKHEGPDVFIKVMTSVNSPIGYYKVLIESYCAVEESPGSPNITKITCAEEIFILFNAWCPEDTVYLESDAERQEYILNDTGLIWVGTHRDHEPIHWNFGQYEICVLECAVYLLTHANLAVGSRADPIKLSRALSALVNSNDDNGILWGRWTETYPDNTTDPTEWVGSVEILRQYLLNEAPVRYGQCWVFSGVLTTLMRCLGIPCRSVTNFESGHDTDCSYSIDCHYDVEGNPMDELDDSIWNFHVWNEAWFSRPDLPPGYGGWQAVDATPQEASEAVMRCGPCPLKAIKEGDVYLPYDTGFMFSEVNGDRIWWKVERDGDMTMEYVDEACIGKHISTKAVGSDEREDITHLYKYPENSKQGNAITEKVSQFGSRKELNIRKVNRDVEVEIGQEQVVMGKDITIPITITNKSAKQSRTVSLSAHIKCAAYTGRTDNKQPLIKSLSNVLELSKKESDTVNITIPATDYMKKIRSGSRLRMFLQLKVQETKQVYATQESFLVKKGTGVSIAVEDKTVQQYQDFEITCSFTNNTGTKLTRCYFYLEGPGIRRSKKLYCGTVQPDSTIERKLTLSAYRIGERKLFVKFCNMKIADAVDSVVITVEEAAAADVV